MSYEKVGLLLDPIGYICPKCRAELYGRYRPFCGECGQRLPSPLRLQGAGLTMYPFHYGRPIYDLDEIAAFLRDKGEAAYWLEAYYASHRTTRIGVPGNGRQDADYEILCGSTRRIELPIGNGWRGVLSVRREEALVCLYDEANKVTVKAGSVSLHRVESF